MISASPNSDAVAVEAARQVTLDVVADDDGIAAEDAVAVR